MKVASNHNTSLQAATPMTSDADGPASVAWAAMEFRWRRWERRASLEEEAAPRAGCCRRSRAGSLIIALASASLVLGDAGAASAFIVSTPRKLQADELPWVDCSGRRGGGVGWGRWRLRDEMAWVG